MKLIIQVPCYNEAETLDRTILDLPRSVPGFDTVEYLVIDDGSTDGTSDKARALGVHHVVRHPRNLGLARAFQTGLDCALRFGADVIVNTDADNQYPGRYIPRLTAPVIARTADVVIGDRQTDTIEHFSPIKRLLQRLGTSTVRALSGTEVADAPSGFRAYSREAALRLVVLSSFSYTLETIIQAGKSGLTIANIPITTNAPLRPSRLHRGTLQFVVRQASTMLRLYAFYEPVRMFTLMSLPFLLVGGGAWARFIFLHLTSQSGIARHIQSVTIGTGLLVVGALILLFGLQADIGNKHRQLTQLVLYRIRKFEYRLLSSDEGIGVINADAQESIGVVGDRRRYRAPRSLPVLVNPDHGTVD
ncbi:MAG TPA: glycosyltransferase family 2 protein [Gammaproteobacteria bacterium]|nr:glycosyltransferase family 2 protein [Gammaproteobacteria bacterium]